MKWTALLLFLSLLFIPLSHAKFDLAVEWIKIDRKVVGEGEIIEINAKVINLGESNPFYVSFYYDFIDEEHLIARKYYESINVYRLPSVKWDTKGLEGKHTIFACVEDDYKENNCAFCNISILETKPDENEGKIVICEVYYHARPNRNNEYVCIANPGKEDVEIERWYLTTEPWKRADEQNKVIFPDVKLKGGEKIYITQNGSSFKIETGFDADFEWHDSSPLPNLEKKGKFVLPNHGGVVCLKDKYNHTIDVVVYGDASYNRGWNGKAIKNVDEGVVLKRKDFIDTNTSKDWEWNRTYIIGQSDFPPLTGTATMAIAFCSPDCSYEVLSEEIQNASEITINMYMFTNPFLADLLDKINATVRVFLDGNVLGGLPVEERYIAWMLSKKGEVRYMMANEEEGIYKRYRYNHAKYAIIDKKCVIESANWVKSGIPVDNSYGNREWGILIENESLANYLSTIFSYDWNPSFQDSIEFNEKSFTHGKPPEDFSMNYFIPKGDYVAKFSPLYVNSSFNFTVILAPDNAEKEIIKLLDSAEEEILIEQAYIEKEWDGKINPFLKKIIEKNESGVRVKIILNYNPSYYSTNRMNEEICKLLKNIDVRLSDELNVHNKGVIVDGKKVLISSINWAENSVRRNREIGIILESKEIAEYFEKIFWYDWNYKGKEGKETGYKNIFIFAIFIITFLLIYLNRRR